MVEFHAQVSYNLVKIFKLAELLILILVVVFPAPLAKQNIVLCTETNNLEQHPVSHAGL